MAHYILQTVIFQLVFLMIYDAFLKNETFFNWNRFYLLISALLSVILPFIKIESFKTVLPNAFVFTLPEVIIGSPENTISSEAAVVDTVAKTASTFTFNWQYLVYLGCVIALVLFVNKLYKLALLVYRNPKIKLGKALLIELQNSKHAFSFFNYIFIGNEIKTEERQTILAHELEHVKEKHSLDLLFFEALKILFWFNPLIYMYQKRIGNLHEFIADSKAVKSSSKVSYYQNLLSQVFETQNVAFINPFFKQSLIKKRIIMLSKSKSNQINLAKYLLVFPMVIGMLFYTSCESQVVTPTEEVSNVSEAELVDKYIDEIRLLMKEKEFYTDKSEGYKNFISTENNNYLYTLDEYSRFKACMTVLFEDNITNDSLNKMEKVKSQKFIDDYINKTYSDYLERKKTQKAIDHWENSLRKHQLRKYVKDLDNITSDEQKLIDSQIAQIKIDDWYHILIISDGLRHKKIESEKVKMEVEEITKEVSFAAIDETPVFPGCDDSVSNDEQRKCFSDKINEIVRENFNVNLGKSLHLKGKQRIYARFTIDKNGSIADLKVRAPHPELEKEARRVVKLIPQLKPGKQDGKPVNVTFDLPIIFNVAE